MGTLVPDGLYTAAMSVVLAVVLVGTMHKFAKTGDCVGNYFLFLVSLAVVFWGNNLDPLFFAWIWLRYGLLCNLL